VPVLIPLHVFANDWVLIDPSQWVGYGIVAVVRGFLVTHSLCEMFGPSIHNVHYWLLLFCWYFVANYVVEMAMLFLGVGVDTILLFPLLWGHDICRRGVSSVDAVRALLRIHMGLLNGC
jgi:hypothetical protein